MYEKRQDNTTYPTKKGIALDLEKWLNLHCWLQDTVNETIEAYDDPVIDADMMIHLGSFYYVSLKQGYPVVNIRRWFLPENEDEIKPQRTCITLTFKQWGKLKDAMIVLQDMFGSEMDKVTFRELSDDHQNQMGMVECKKCNPYGTFI
ncbi:hypothetical protein KP79_PYT14618 [Mizuhopecten yessoensis]|uniref:Uncharacterized protein n=1 Tax=Mizuhopecten yessoensis TaxID=6573 RepID=A0A210QJ66_MIZYE|nr:hypothetical protein KP79_PYT14618 [Mizuhopecten yessoensis]